MKQLLFRASLFVGVFLVYQFALAADLPAIYGSETVDFNPMKFDYKSSTARQFASWIPDAQPETLKDSTCAPESLKAHVLANPTDAKNLLLGFLNRCLPTWRNDKTGLDVLIRFISSEYDLSQSRDVSFYKIKLLNGQVIQGALGLKNDNEARPLLIVACGVMCNAGSGSSVYMMMQLFDETPFHVLILSNHTSESFYKDNGTVGLGGVDAADALFRLARYFRNPSNPYFSKISEIHVFGISLGSHEAFYTAIMNSLHQRYFGDRPITSFSTFCPVIDYSASVNSLYEQTNLPAKKTVENIQTILNPLAQALGFDLNKPPMKSNGKTDYATLNNNLYFANQLDFQKRYPGDAPWSFPDFTSVAELLEFSKFQNHVQDIIDPVFVLASADDPVVSQKLNAQTLLNLPQSQDNFTTIIGDAGAHCASSITYGWRNISLTLQSYILAHSPRFTSRTSIKLLPLDLKKIEKVAGKKPSLYSYAWTTNPNNTHAELVLRFNNPNSVIHPSCKWTPEKDPTKCFTYYRTSFPLTSFAKFTRTPTTIAESQALTRWLNVQVPAMDDNGQSAMASKRPPTHLEFVEL